MKGLVLLIFGIILGICGVISGDDTLKISAHIWLVGSIIINTRE